MTMPVHIITLCSAVCCSIESSRMTSFDKILCLLRGFPNCTFLCVQVLCPRCEVATGPHKTPKSKRAKEAAQSGSKYSAKLDCLGDVERALLESKDSASAVCALTLSRSVEER